MKIISNLLLVCILSMSAFGQDVAEPERITPQVDFELDLTKYVCPNQERLTAVRKLFFEKGVPIKEQRILNLGGVRDLEIVKRGTTNETIIIGAHYDNKGSCGVIDNWSGITIMANIYAALKDVTTKKTYKFVAFGREEEGLIGSKAYVKQMSKEDMKLTCVMVNFDSFGVAEIGVMTNASSKKVVKFTLEKAKSLEIDMKAVKKRRARTDSNSFIKKGIPAIAFHGLPKDWRGFLHSIADNPRNLDPSLVYSAYQFGIDFVRDLDRLDCGEFK